MHIGFLRRVLVVLVILTALLSASPASAAEEPGDVFTTGGNYAGALGHGNFYASVRTPVRVGGMPEGVVDLATGWSHSLALAADGTVYAWGSDRYGQLGTGEVGGPTAASAVPVVVSGLDDVNIVDVEAGYYHSLALTDTGDVYAWGRNQAAQLARADLQSRGVPTLISALANVVSISGGLSHSVAALDDGTVWAWGDNSQRQIGDDSGAFMRRTPVQVSSASGMAPIETVKAGGEHTLAIGDDGSLWIWGSNTSGQIGNGTKLRQPTPQRRQLDGPVADAAGGANHSVALLADGTVQTWGLNDSGQLGIGSSAYEFTQPQAVASISDAVSVGSGIDHSLVVLSDATVVGFGRNGNGQLGDGTARNRNAPVAMLGVTNISAVAGGRGQSALLRTIGDGVPDITPPAGSWSEPLNGLRYFQPLRLLGNATDDIGVAEVEMVVRDLETNLFWHPETATWGGYNRFSVPVDVPGAVNTDFSFLFAPPLPAVYGSYRARLWVVDLAGNRNTTALVTKFSLFGEDTSRPFPFWTSPEELSTGPGPILLEGEIQDIGGVDRAEIVIRDRVTRLYWNGTGWGEYTVLIVPVAEQGAGRTTFSYSFDPPDGSGEYRARLWGVDTSENRNFVDVGRRFSIG